jgi:uncharacterized NAD(P)/FAD-binding protein YdhS
MPQHLPEIVVIGGGFSGAAFALHLLRDNPDLAAHITIVEPRATLGAGLAYSVQTPEHRINTSAARMAVFADDPTHFDRWLRESGRLTADPHAEADGIGAFPQRATFGDYVHAQLLAAAAASPHAELRHVRAQAVGVHREEHRFRVTLQHGEDLGADVLVLATGHPAPDVLPPLRGLAGDDRLIADPWTAGAVARIGPEARVLIVGTGLTMGDMVASLRAQGHRGPIVAVSRRGLLPRPRIPVPLTPTGNFIAPPIRSATALLRRVRHAIAGRPWQDAIEALRVQGRTVWAALPPQERQRLLRHVQPFWDVHRYQCAPQIDAVLRHDLAIGVLRIVAASIRGATRQADGSLKVELHPRRTPAEVRQSIACDAIILCTGPSHRTALVRNPLLQSLSAAGLIRPDAFGLGIEVDDRGCAIGAAGDADPALLVVGPPARGTWGELMGLPQVSTQPREVAAGLVRHLANAPLPQEELI